MKCGTTNPPMTQERLFDPEETAPPRPDGGCVYYRHCGNMAPGADQERCDNEICNRCLSALRSRGQRGEPEDYDVEAFLIEEYNE